jgi:acyl phosphate:glycerol-3-phosphate acyltransferase
MISLMVSLALGYLIGSIPTSFIFAKVVKKVDIRRHGSGNVGATNVLRVVGKFPALAVLLIDIFKGAFVVLFLPVLFFNNEIGIRLGLEPYRILLGLSAMSGHVWSIFLKGKGGKGVATTAGVLLILAPKVFICSVFVWVIAFAALRIVSIASITASVVLPVFAVIFRQSIWFILFCVLICIVGTYKHKPNIQRLIRGEEKKLF